MNTESYPRIIEGPSRHVSPEYQDHTQYEHLEELRVAVVGSMGTGKNSFIYRIFHDMWEEEWMHDPAQPERIDYYQIPGGKVQARWDGCHFNYEGYRALMLSTILQAEVALLFYAVDRRDSFEDMKQFWRDWEQFLREEPSELSQLGVPPIRRNRQPLMVYIVASKIDVDPSGWEVSLKEGEELSKEIGAAFLKISSKENIGTTKDDVVKVIQKAIYQRYLNEQATSIPSHPTRDKTSAENEVGTKKPSRLSKILDKFAFRS